MHPDTEAQMAGVAQGVLDRTRAGDLAWMPTDRDSYYLASVGNATVRIGYVPDYDEPGAYEFAILSESGQAVETMFVNDNPRASKRARALMSDLLEYARRSALDIDAVLGSLLDELDASPLDLNAPPAYNPDEEPF